MVKISRYKMSVRQISSLNLRNGFLSPSTLLTIFLKPERKYIYRVCLCVCNVNVNPLCSGAIFYNLDPLCSGTILYNLDPL